MGGRARPVENVRKDHVLPEKGFEWYVYRYLHTARHMVLKGLALVSLSVRTPSLFLIPLASVPPVLFSFLSAGRKSALLANIMALSFSQNTLGVFKIDSFRTGCIMLSGLFLYDIWCVDHSTLSRGAVS